MSKLLSIFSDTILPILILVIAIGIAIALYFYMKKKYNIKTIASKQTNNKNPQVKLKGSYCTEEEMKFLEALHKALPRDCISFPNVGVSKLIEPKGNLVDYNSVLDKYVDVCVFLRKDMTPILVIDLYQSSPVAQQLKKFDENVSNVLKVVKIPVLHKQIDSSYNIEDLKIEVLQAMNSTTVAYLKDKTITDTSSK